MNQSLRPEARQAEEGGMASSGGKVGCSRVWEGGLQRALGGTEEEGL